MSVVVVECSFQMLLHRAILRGLETSKTPLELLPKLILLWMRHWQHVPPNTMHWAGYNIVSVVFVPKMHNLNLIISKH